MKGENPSEVLTVTSICLIVLFFVLFGPTACEALGVQP